MTDEQIEAQIAASPEYFALAGARTPAGSTASSTTSSGARRAPRKRQHVLTLLGSSSRLSVGLSILNSGEAITRRVQQAFPRFLRRTANVRRDRPRSSPRSSAASPTSSSSPRSWPPTSTSTSARSSSPIRSPRRRATGCAPPTAAARPTATWPSLTVPQCTPPSIVTQPQNVTLDCRRDVLRLASSRPAQRRINGIRAQSGDPSNPVSGAHRPGLHRSINNVGSDATTGSRVTNSCGSTNSNTVTVTTQLRRRACWR